MKGRYGITSMAAAVFFVSLPGMAAAQTTGTQDFVTRTELERAIASGQLITKDEMRRTLESADLVKKSDLQRYATKDDLAALRVQLETLRERLRALRSRVGMPEDTAARKVQ